MNKTTHHLALAVAFALATLTPTWGSFAEEGDQFSEDDLQPPIVEMPDSPPQSPYQACLNLPTIALPCA